MLYRLPVVLHTFVVGLEKLLKVFELTVGRSCRSIKVTLPPALLLEVLSVIRLKHSIEVLAQVNETLYTIIILSDLALKFVLSAEDQSPVVLSFFLVG